jgi:hypothetical protein
MKPTKQNYYALCEIAYNLTGHEHWLNKPANDRCMNENFIVEFHSVKKQIQDLIKNGNIYRFPLYNLETKQAKNFIGNTYNFNK